MQKPDLSILLEAFFHKRLISQRRVSPHTIASYRDTFRLLLVFAQQRFNRPPSQLALKDLGPSLVSDFLDQLEAERNRIADQLRIVVAGKAGPAAGKRVTQLVHCDFSNGAASTKQDQQE